MQGGGECVYFRGRGGGKKGGGGPKGFPKKITSHYFKKNLLALWALLLRFPFFSLFYCFLLGGNFLGNELASLILSLWPPFFFFRWEGGLSIFFFFYFSAKGSNFQYFLAKFLFFGF